MEYHPDKNAGDKKAEANTKKSTRHIKSLGIQQNDRTMTNLVLQKEIHSVEWVGILLDEDDQGRDDNLVELKVVDSKISSHNLVGWDEVELNSILVISLVEEEGHNHVSKPQEKKSQKKKSKILM